MPNIHPLLVHFPVALLLFSFVAELAAEITKDGRFAHVGWWSQLAGSAGVAAAVISGLVAEGSVVVKPEAYEVFEVHEEMAFVAAIIFGVLLLWRLGMRSVIPAKWRWLFLAAYAAGVIIISATAWYGGELVYTFGTGVR